ncbi:MAG: tetratricopeptide repeat protein [Armatimonadia bacterium]|nr:tetratricopeptide repeat protein [Armatimonadia bacterium]
MKRALLIGLIALLLATSMASAADLTDAERQELLAWVKTLRYQARVDQALAVCDMILANQPRCVEALIEHGLLAISEERFENAKEDFRQALKHDRKHPMALVGRAHAHQALEDFDAAGRDAAKTLERCDRLIARDRADAETYYASGAAKMLLEDDSALQDFVMAVSLDPGHMDAHTERAHVYRAQGRTQDAIDQLTKAVDIRPDYAVGYLARARLHFEQSNFDASIADCGEALEINPEYARAWHNRGLVSMQTGDLETAIADLTQAIDADPEYASAHVYRAQAYVAYGNEAAARADLERAQELEPDGWAGQAAKKLLKELQQAADQGE